MADNLGLNIARRNKRDEFYTQYDDINSEINTYDKKVFYGKTVLCPCNDSADSNFTKYFIDNFERLGLRKLICTSYVKGDHGKLLVMASNTKDIKYLDDDGDFRSDEVTRLRDKSDIIITNCPFSLFTDFIDWVTADNKLFSVIGNINEVTCKNVFPLIMSGKVYLGNTIHSGDRKFYVPDDYPLNAYGCGVDSEGQRYIRVKGVRWYTNIPSVLDRKTIKLNTMEYNLKNNSKLRNKLIKDFGQSEDNLHYPIYDHYNAIEVPFTDCIPCDYKGIMGVPITFLDKYNSKQFKIVGCSTNKGRPKSFPKDCNMSPVINVKNIYSRIFISNNDT